MQSLPSDLKSSQCNWLIKKESFTIDSLLWTMIVNKRARGKQGSLLCIAFNRLFSDLNIAQIMHH